jgi:serine/threonine protein phosphatase PrpC
MMETTAMQWVWHSAQQTHRGKRRRNNEDAVLSRSREGLWAVADGMGGHQAGEVASQAITAALSSVALCGPLSAQVDAVEDVLVTVNDELRLHAHSRGCGTTIGSTVVAMVTQDDLAVVLWAGDSRLYRLREGRLEQITRDHNPISDLLDSGAVSEAEVLAAETNIITRAVGGQPRLFLDLAVFDVMHQDTYLLCSDGLYRDLDLEALAAHLGAATLDNAAEALLAQCLEGPAYDNISLVVVRSECQ